MNIPLTRGQSAIVDEADYEWLNQWKWHVSMGSKNRTYHARRSFEIDGRTASTTMHRQIMGLERGDRREVDHINRNTLDNRRANLRIVTTSENNFNKAKRPDNTSGFTGVYKVKNKDRWIARTTMIKKVFSLGIYCSAVEASDAYERFQDKHRKGLKYN